jgi:hypothetical protein
MGTPKTSHYLHSEDGGRKAEVGGHNCSKFKVKKKTFKDSEI